MTAPACGGASQAQRFYPCFPRLRRGKHGYFLFAMDTPRLRTALAFSPAMCYDTHDAVDAAAISQEDNTMKLCIVSAPRKV